ncbi:MAG: tetratricopeptide repeat protein [Planctomycetes bacterium]|nr:tetratricopeptide repeat protein [Planctomycetota bacterium]
MTPSPRKRSRLPLALALAAAALALVPGPGRAQDGQPPRRDEARLTFTFRRASIHSFLGYLSREAGFTFIEEAAVTGDITAIAEQPITRDQALEVLRGWLLPKQRTIVRTADVVRIVTLDEARRRGLPVRIGADPSSIADSEELVTQVMPLKYIRAEDVQRELSQLLSDKGQLMKEATSNALVVTDTSASIRRLAEVLAALDQAVTSELHVRVYRLKNADATEVSTIVRELFQGEPAARGGGGGGGANPQEMMRMFMQGGGAGPAAGTGGAQTNPVNVSADLRTNAIVVTASTDQLRLLDSLIEELDKDPATVVTEFKAFPLTNASAIQMAATLEKIFQEEQQTQQQGRGGQRGGQGGGPAADFIRRMTGFAEGGEGGVEAARSRYAPRPRFATDERTNTLIVTAAQSDMTMIERLVKDLDKDPTETSGVLVIQLNHAAAGPLATVLTQVLADSQSTATTAGRQQNQRGGRQAAAATAAPQGGTDASNLIGNVTVTADETSNALVLTTSPKNFDRLRSIVGQLDVARREVFIECLIAEVQLSDRGELGIQWNAAFSNSAENAKEGTQTVGTDWGLNNLRDGIRYTTSSDKLTALLRALRTEGRLDILSSPKILVMENMPAEISVGQEVPFVTNSRITNFGDTVNTIQYRDVGIILRVTPQISHDGTVRMTVHPEVSSIAPDSESVPISEGVRSPTFNKNFADTTIVVRTGQTAVIGGMIRDSYSETFFKIPLLGDIPIFGRLFGSTIREKVKQEIVVFLTPHVIETPGQLTRRSQEVVQQFAYVPTEIMNSELDRWLRNLQEDSHAYQYNRGTVLLESGRVDEAIKALEKARDAAPRHAATRVNLALALARAGLYERAELELREALVLDPTDAEIAYDLGAVLWRQGDFVQAARMFERALLVAPDHPEAQRWLHRARREAARVESDLLREPERRN